MTEFAASSTRPARPRRLRDLAIVLSLAIVALLVVAAASASAAVTEVNLAQYKRIHRYALPLPPGTPAPAHSLLAEEASGVTYDPVTETLFVVGDGGTSVVQVSKEGQLINSMTLAPGSSPQGTTFYDTEGIAYVGNEEFVITEERESKLDRFKYVAGGELTRAAAKTVVIGKDNDNIGIEGVTNDPLNPGHMIAIKESGPERIYSTDIDWEAQTATNFEAEGTGPGEGELFPAADAGTLDFSDVYALANVPGIAAAEESNLLVISQESGEVVNISRSGHVNSRLAELAEPADTISVPDMTNEGVTMDQNGMLYVVDEDGGGSQAHPQLWVYEPQTTADTAPTAVTLGSQVNTLPESTTGARVKVATVTVTDPDGFGENNLSVAGPDASHFEVDHNGLYLKAGTTLKASAQAEYEVRVQVDDPTSVANPDATSSPYKLTVTPSSGGTSAAQIAVTEVAPWSSGNSPVAADWFELTNVGTTKVDMTGWRMNDNHASFASSDAIEGVTNLAPGHSAVFVNGTEAKANEFIADWYPGGAPTGFEIGWLPEGPGLSTSGDQVNIYDSTGAKVSGVEIGASPSAAPFGTFDNTAALGVGATVDPTLTALSTVGTNEAFSADAGNEIGSPGTAPVSSPLAVTEAAPWGSSNVEYKADWFELTNESPVAVSLAGWKMDDSSNAFGTAVALHGVSSIAAGESVLFLETAEGITVSEEGEVVTKFETSWFGSSVPAGLQVGTYHGSGVGLSTGGDAVNIFESEGNRITGVSFGAASTASPVPSFENAAGLGNYKAPVAITALSVEGVNGGFVAHDQLG
ncbi:MAG TPA: SdiA-regulated domain-containing protein, partial [Solirubrobacterales bacterium]